MKKNKSKLFKIKQDLSNSYLAKASLLESVDIIETAIDKMYSSLKRGGKIIFCGNGGSASDAQHFTAEMIVKIKKKRKPLAALNLIQDISTITACSNDYGFEDVFSRNLDALGNKKDILIVISTSGKSRNIIKVLKTAKRKKIYSIGFFGKKSHHLLSRCNLCIFVNSNEVTRIQEAHTFLGHFILSEIEKKIN